MNETAPARCDFMYERYFSLAEANIDMAFQTSLLLFYLVQLGLNGVHIVLGGTQVVHLDLAFSEVCDSSRLMKFHAATTQCFSFLP